MMPCFDLKLLLRQRIYLRFRWVLFSNWVARSDKKMNRTVHHSLTNKTSTVIFGSTACDEKNQCALTADTIYHQNRIQDNNDSILVPPRSHPREVDAVRFPMDSAQEDSEWHVFEIVTRFWLIMTALLLVVRIRDVSCHFSQASLLSLEWNRNIGQLFQLDKIPASYKSWGLIYVSTCKVYITSLAVKEGDFYCNCFTFCMPILSNTIIAVGIRKVRTLIRLSSLAELIFLNLGRALTIAQPRFCNTF